MLKKKMHEIDSTLQSKDESDHFSFFYPSVVVMVLVQQYFHEQR